MWPETSGNVTPLYLARRSDLFLPRFIWYGELRPTSVSDIFIIPQGMEDLMSDRPITEIAYRKELQAIVPDESEPVAAGKSPESAAAVMTEQENETPELTGED